MTLAYTLVLDELQKRPTQPLLLAEPVDIKDLPTPALLLDEAALDRNIAKMAGFLQARGKGFRPHAKTHKCPEIAARQMAAGAAGICAAKVSEAAVLVNSGISDVLITSAVMSPDKAALVAKLSAEANIDIVVDSLEGLRMLSAAVEDHQTDGANLGVLIDLDIEMGRTGTRSDEAMLDLAQSIADAPRLTFRGVQHYAGHLMHVEGFDARRDRSLSLWEKVIARVGILQDRGFFCEVVTGCGTGTFNIDCEVELITDLQVGSYVFMDQEYRLIGGRETELFEDFEVALTVATTAISQPMDVAVTVDGGYKAFASDTVDPEPLDLAGSRSRL